MRIRSWPMLLPHYERLSNLDFECFGKSRWTHGNIRGLFENLNLTIILDFEEEKLVGFIAFSAIPPESELLKIGVQSDHRRRSVGKRLIGKMIVTLLEQGSVEKIFLEVRSDNRPAISFYETLNFRKTGLRKNYYTHPAADAVLLIREL
jgi:[ribosomal protein S18]-alanine N-acetyltransferase